MDPLLKLFLIIITISGAMMVFCMIGFIYLSYLDWRYKRRTKFTSWKDWK